MGTTEKRPCVEVDWPKVEHDLKATSRRALETILPKGEVTSEVGRWCRLNPGWLTLDRAWSQRRSQRLFEHLKPLANIAPSVSPYCAPSPLH